MAANDLHYVGSQDKDVDELVHQRIVDGRNPEVTKKVGNTTKM